MGWKYIPSELTHGRATIDITPGKFVETAKNGAKIARVKSKSKTFSGDPILTDPDIITYLELFDKKQYDAYDLVDIFSREHPLNENLPKGGWTTDRVLDLFVRYKSLSLAKRNTSKTPRVNSAADAKALNSAKEARRINSPSDVKKYNKRYR